MSEVVTQLDLQNHINRDYRQVHQGSWAQIKAYIDSTDTEVEEDQIDDEMTHDETWRDFTCVGRTGYIGQRYVILSVHCATETWAEGLAWIQLHRDGETAGWRYYFHASGAIKSVVPDAAADYDSGEVTLPLTNGQFHYKSLEADGGVVTVKIVGYKNGTGAGDVSHTHQLIQVTDFPWVDCRNYGSFILAVDAIGATEAVLLISEEEAVAADKAVPANVTLKFLQGGTLNISAGKTVTINQQPQAGLYQIFEGSGSIKFGVNSIREAYPEWWGIDGTADEVQINAAINSLPVAGGVGSFGVTPGSFGGTVWLNGTYTTAAPVIIFEGIVLDGHSMFTTEIYNGATADEDAVQAVNGGRAANEFFPAIKNMKITGNGSSGNGLYVYKPNYGIYENLLIKGHGKNGIFIRGPQVGGTFRNIYSAYNSGWGCMAGDVNEDVDITVLRFYDCKFRENTLGGTLLFQNYQTTMDNPIFEDNAGPGLRIEGKYSVITNPYFEDNYGGSQTITGATQANPCVITCSAGHIYTNGQKVTIFGVVGMTELNGNEYTVANETDTTFELSGVDSSGYGAYTSGGTVAADTLEINRDNTSCHSNSIICPFLSDGIIHIEGADYNQIISPRLGETTANIIIDVNSDYNRIAYVRGMINPLSIIDNGVGTCIYDDAGAFDLGSGALTTTGLISGLGWRGESAAGSNTVDVRMQHAGAPAANIIQWAWSVRSNNEDLVLYGYNGTDYKNIFILDWTDAGVTLAGPIEAPTALITSIKSGANQAAAGAAAGELWKTSGHASLPDNVIMIGI